MKEEEEEGESKNGDRWMFGEGGGWEGSRVEVAGVTGLWRPQTLMAAGAEARPVTPFPSSS